MRPSRAVELNRPGWIDVEKQGSGRMTKKPLRIVAVSAGSWLAIVIAAGVLRSKPKPVEKVLVPVRVAAVQLNSAERGERYSATIIPRTEVELAFRVGGYVDALQQVRGIDRKMRD